MFKDARKTAELSIEAAAFHLHIGSRTLVNYENGITRVPPETALLMADVYGQPALPARYCKEICPIGQKHACNVEDRSLAESVLGLLKEHRDVGKKLDILVEIASDGIITSDEQSEFDAALEELRHLQQKIQTIMFLAAMKRSRNKKAPRAVAEPTAAYQTC